MKKMILIAIIVIIAASAGAETIDVDDAFSYTVPDSMARILGKNLQQMGIYVAVQDSLNRTQLISVYTKKDESDFTVMLTKISQVKWENIEKIYQLKQKGEFKGLHLLYRAREINGIPVKQYIVGSKPKPMIHVYLKLDAVYRIDFYLEGDYMKEYAPIIEKSINSIQRIKK